MHDPLRTYDYLTLARTKVFDWVRPLTPAQYTQTFPIGLGSLARTLTHVMICEWFYMQRMQQLPVPPYEQWPIQDETPPPFAKLEAEWTTQAPRTRAALAAARANTWDAPIDYCSTHDPQTIFTASAADIFTQMALHEVHHRAQCLNMLRHLGVKTEDIDFNALMYKRRKATA